MKYQEEDAPVNGCTARKETKIQNPNKEAKEEKRKRIVCAGVRDEAIEEKDFCVRWKCLATCSAVQCSERCCSLLFCSVKQQCSLVAARLCRHSLGIAVCFQGRPRRLAYLAMVLDPNYADKKGEVKE